MALAREHRVPMRVANLVLEEMTEAPNRGRGERDSRSPMLLQEERAGVQVRASPEALRTVLERDPPATGERSGRTSAPRPTGAAPPPRRWARP